ncbi:MAG: LacI family DNA-binding transcriptional regulator, partial [Planctomycetota bacterium]
MAFPADQDRSDDRPRDLMAVTLKDIAALANTSQATVSLVLNGKQFHRVSPAMREKIEQIAKRLNYQPNHQAQTLASGRTMAAAVLVNTLTNAFYSKYVGLIESRLADRGYNVTPFETLSDASRERALLDMPSRRMCDVVVSLDHATDPQADRENSGSPIVARVEDFNEQLEVHGDFEYVKVDYAGATTQMLDALKKTGAQRIGLLMSAPHALDAAEPSLRSRFFSQQVDDSSAWGGNVAAASVSEAAEFEEWHDAARRLLESSPRIDALFIHNAHVAPPVLAAAADAGRTVGGDLACATFDDPE